MATLFSILFGVSIALLVLLALKVSFFIYFSANHLRSNRNYDNEFEGRKICYSPSVSIIVPAFNEELVLENCVQSLLSQSYPFFEIIIVDDGSSDKTPEIGSELADKYNKVSYYRIENSGKAAALNYGTEKSEAEIVVCIDADSILEKDALWHLTLPFSILSVGAVGGNVKVINRSKLINMHQAVEYIVGLNIQRRAFSQMGCMQVISGAIGAFRRKTLLSVGGYSQDTMVEDMDITIAINRAGYDVIFAPKAIAYTETPETIQDFIKQRYRWTLGGFKILQKYSDMLFNPKYGRMGMVGLPYFMIFPWIDVVISLLLIVSLALVTLTGNYFVLLAYLIVMLMIQTTLVMYALKIDREHWYMALLVILENIWYSHLINFITIRAGIDCLANKSTSWNKVTRLGKNKFIVTGASEPI